GGMGPSREHAELGGASGGRHPHTGDDAGPPLFARLATVIDDVHGRDLPWLAPHSASGPPRDNPGPGARRWSSHVLPAVGVEAGTGDEPRSVVGKKCYAARHFLGRAEASHGNEWQNLGFQDLLWHRSHHLADHEAPANHVD